MSMKTQGISKALVAAAIVVFVSHMLIMPAVGTAATANRAGSSAGGTAEDVRHELRMLPYYGVFDNLSFQVQDDGTVVLSGQVVRPTLRSDAENVVRRLAGVSDVVNRIEVLPLSRFDDWIRMATYRALFSSPWLDRYSMGAIPSIHIIVRNGDITLEGVVATQTDKDVAGLIANGVPGTFRVTNNLTAERKS
jgi:hyperosmotically inducible periplasmic protein